MITTKKRGNLIIISGTTCAGKGTVIKELMKRNDTLSLSISYTSRPVRPGDVEGETYYFVTKEVFEDKIEKGEFLEYAKVHYGAYYGTPKAEIETLLESGKDVILEIEVQGAVQVKALFPETILIFILAPTMEELVRRIKTRSTECNDQIVERFKTAYNEINEVGKYNYVVVNDKVENAVHKIEAILVSEKCRVDRIEEMHTANQEEIIHEILMDKEFDNKIKHIDA